MHSHRPQSLRASLFMLLLLLLSGALAAPLQGQERPIVFSQITVSGSEASIALEFADGEEMSVTLRDRSVLVNGEEVGRYTPGGPLDAAWRALLGRAIAADDAEIAGILRGWSPPAGLDEESGAAARALDARLERALDLPGAEPGQIRPEGDVEALVEQLLLRTDRLRALASAIRGLETEDIRVHVGSDVTVAEGEVITASVLVLDGDLNLDGEVTGDVLVLGGRITLGDDARVGGDLRWSDAEITGNRDAVSGRIREVQPVPDRPEADLREEIRRDVRASIEAARPQADRRPFRVDRRSNLMRNIAHGMGRIFQTAVSLVILLGMGLLLLYFAPRNFEIVARTARNAPGRSALVGLAGGVLFLPAWIIGIVALTITIIGIPVMLLWLPLFPLAVALAITAGYLAVARNLGQWASSRPVQGLEAWDASRPAVQLGAGLVVLLAAFALAGLFQMGGAWLSMFRGLLMFIGVALSIFAGMVGFGAVLLSRGGRDPLYAGPGWSYGGPTDPWAPEPDPFDAGPYPGEPGAPHSGGEPGAAHGGGEPGTAHPGREPDAAPPPPTDEGPPSEPKPDPGSDEGPPSEPKPDPGSDDTSEVGDTPTDDDPRPGGAQ